MASMVLTHEPEELSEKPINSADHWTPLPKTLVLGLGLEICSTTNTSSDFLINNFPLRKSNLVKDLWTMLILEVHMCVHAHTHPPPHTHPCHWVWNTDVQHTLLCLKELYFGLSLPDPDNTANRQVHSAFVLSLVTAGARQSYPFSSTRMIKYWNCNFTKLCCCHP